jgi:uncharacterized protein (DUF2141 family)
MKKATLIILMITSIWAGDIRVHITEVNRPLGDVYVGLYRQAKGFLHTDRAYKQIIQKAKQSLYCRFKNIPKGTYAIAIFHDANRNGKLDTNFIGIPKEQTGTSNNVVSRLGPPSFEKAIFKHAAATKLSIRLR